MERAGRAGEAGDDFSATGEVVARARSGDEGAWHALVGRHLGLVHAICRGHGLHDDAAAEVSQLVWLQLVEHLARIRTPDAIGGWIAATARSLCLAPQRASHRSGYLAAAVVRPPPSANGKGHSHGHARVNGSPLVGEVARLAAAFARIGARCQRLLRLAALRPRPSDEDASAALDLPVAGIGPTCLGCLDRLRVLAGSETPEVLPALRQALADHDPVPAAWWDAAWSAYAWHTLDAVAAQRVYDSIVVVGRDHAGVARGAFAAGFAPFVQNAQSVRRLRFSTPDQDIELVVDGNGDEILLAGRLVTGRDADVTVRWPGGQRSTLADETGAFRFSGLPVAPLCLHTAGPHAVKTGWILP